MERPARRIRGAPEPDRDRAAPGAPQEVGAAHPLRGRLGCDAAGAGSARRDLEDPACSIRGATAREGGAAAAGAGGEVGRPAPYRRTPEGAAGKSGGEIGST